MAGPKNGQPRDHRIGVPGAVSFVCGAIIGSGIFLSPSTVMKATSSMGLALTIWGVSAIVSVMGAFCYVELGTAIQKSGGDFAYMQHMGWKKISFSFGAMLSTILYPATTAIQSRTFAEYLVEGLRMRFENESQAYWYKIGISFSLVLFLMCLNFFSIKTVVSRFQMVASCAKVSSTILVILVGFYWLIFYQKTENLSEPFAGSKADPASIASAFFAGLFAYDGWDVLNLGAEEIKNPRRTFPLAISLGMGLVAVIFVLVNLSYSIILTVPQIQGSDAVAMIFAREAMGPFQFIMPLMVSVVLIGSVNSNLFCGSRITHAIARAGCLPPFLSVWNPTHGSPRAAIVFQVVLAFVIALSADIAQMLNYAGFTQWAQRVVTVSILLYIRFKGLEVSDQRIRSPIIVPIVFFLCSSSLVLTSILSQPDVAAVGLGLLIGAMTVYMIFVHESALPRFEWYKVLVNNANQCLNKFTEWILNGEVQQSQILNTQEEEKKEESEEPLNPVNPTVEEDQDTDITAEGKV
ncbi:unnamed protein product [Bursaphelenchus xylophilus]|uniref:(pine wood nematode) hypothetical protein n=1 Tax=Bursaphelenchus xylophilus TaxID=6326 RepID=A0A1I7SX92_BURXY|nr:unnamed protein product [Bursaphelenchus xylophilus]CAG9100262.1 unnamed protein product [Bursaphelenchus xylophilus]